jgi:MtN3 and saliva related transmembrane protein
MDYTQLVGIGAAIMTTIANIPQTYKIIKEKNTEGVSLFTYTILLTGMLLWVTYGVLNTDWPIIIANGITALICSMILLLKITSKKIITKIHNKVIPDGVKRKK